MNVRLSLALAAACALLTACADLHGRTPSVAAGIGLVGHSIDEIAAANGPPSRRWVRPDGLLAYQWQSSSVTARVGDLRDGVVAGSASQTTCFYTVYAKPAPQGLMVVGAEPASPGCLKLAMNGVAK